MAQSPYDEPFVFDARANRNAAIRWGSVVVGFLAFTLCLGFAAITLASRDPSVAVIPDYYNKALRWDETVSLRRQSESLEWIVQPSFTANGALNIDIRDAQGKPVSIQSGTIEIYRHARANHIAKHELAAIDDGTIGIENVITHNGWWQIKLDLIDADGNRFVRVSDHEVRR